VRRVHASTSLMKDTYTHGHEEPVVNVHRQRTLESCGGFVLDSGLLRSSTSVLDVGCGPGSITVGFGKRCNRVVGVESSQDMVRFAREQMKENKVDDVVSIEFGDAYKLDYPDSSFDLVFAHQVLQHLSDPVAALEEMSRVAKVAVCVRDADYSSMLAYPPIEEIDEWRDMYRRAYFANHLQPDAGRYLYHWLLQAGFEQADIKMSMSCKHYCGRDEAREIAHSWASRMPTFTQDIVDEKKITEIANGWRRWCELDGAYFYYANGEAIAYK